jgi:3-oxoacyl-[acyl-carrier-protein] synthase III
VRAGILATGSALPDEVLGSAELERRMGLAAGTVEGFLGVRERRIAAAAEAVSDLAVRAALPALEGQPEPELLLLATSTPDHPVPATAPLVAHRLGLRCGAFDVMNACSGWLSALALADAHVRSGGGHVLVVGANVLSRRLDWQGDWSVAGLFGDGAGAALVGPAAQGGILATALVSDGSRHAQMQVPAGGSRQPVTVEALRSGRHLLRIERVPGSLDASVAMLVDAARAALARSGLGPGEVDLFVPHQANARLVSAAAQRLGIPPERTLRNLERVGNTSAASIPILLDEAARSGRLRRGERVLLASVSAGMSAAAAVVAW